MTAVSERTVTAVARKRRISVGFTASAITLAIFVVAALAPNILSTQDPLAMDFTQALQSPSLAHWFGTDESGRDLFSRVVYGTRESLAIGVGAAGLAILVALVLGSIAALAGRIPAGIVNRLIEVLFAFPTLLLALLLVSVLGASPITLVISVGLGSAPGYARMVRGQILSSKNSGYVEAARALGHSRFTIFRQHILPNALRPLIAIFTMGVGQSIVWASGMAFIGLGVAPPSSEWGALLDAGRAYITQASWLVVLPGFVIVVLALAATTLGKHIQSSLEKGETA
ncbi:peptide/nickel transport system permease protein [Okibacterium sp. HSC-33S16]|uniref:ABC transporter permease n=1 Tax=Okibacterium sp. HSC-33S16 TaxID=2910965 RepID=UPI00209F87D8|nr:ABC transporter permease [Okibacterium sp. HSC-33S16]MCP2032354.1 peptide/nickel transport system permease protein [Okibacterium sp. HSC-33S16]